MKAKQEALPQSPAFAFGAQTPIEAIEPGIKRQVLGYNDQIMAARVWFEQGAVGQLHKHPHSQVSYVESGQFDVTVGEETKTLIAGDSFFIAPETLHGAVCKEAGVLIDMFAPMRDDFLPKGGQS
ncbi:MAG: cupin domain-containing protein [Pseudomonadota bacterium]